MIVVLPKTLWKPGLHNNFYGLDIYIYLIYIYLLLLYNSSILDIEHSPYYIGLGSTYNPQSDLATTNNLIIWYNIIYTILSIKGVYNK